MALTDLDRKYDAVMAAVTGPGGRVILIVPAFMFAMSQVDVATGHIRRYTKKSMRAAMQ